LTLFVDTSVWSLALRRDGDQAGREVLELRRALGTGATVMTTGLVLQELLQGFSGPKDRRSIFDRFEPIPLVVPTRDDHVAAAELRNGCRRRGVQVGTIDALLAQLCIHHELVMLSTDGDFREIARYTNLRVWGS
jgi:predicted nucleic acid-binding protein